MLTSDASQFLFSKQGIITVKLASEFLAYHPGDRIKTAKEYARDLDSGTGTVQVAMKLLTDAGAIGLSARGQLGTFITKIDYLELYHFTLRGSIVGAMPLPYSRRYEGFATGLKENFQEKNFDLNLTFIRGSANRLSALDDRRCDFTFLSRMAVEQIEAEGKRFALKHGLGTGTYVSKHIVLLRDNSQNCIQNGMRVGVDTQSSDHMILVKRACEDRQVEFLDMSYMQLLAALTTGRIDATVWNEDDLITSKSQPLGVHRADESIFSDLYPLYSEAVIVVSRDQPGIANL